MAKKLHFRILEIEEDTNYGGALAHCAVMMNHFSCHQAVSWLAWKQLRPQTDFMVVRSSQEAAELRTHKVRGRAERKRSQCMGEHHIILPSIALQSHTEAHES